MLEQFINELFLALVLAPALKFAQVLLEYEQLYLLCVSSNILSNSPEFDLVLPDYCLFVES